MQTVTDGTSVDNRQQKLLIGTHNHGKLQEIERILHNMPYNLITLSQLNITIDVEETGSTFAENAVLKAQHYCMLSHLRTIADDGGLEVDALHGAPGIYSARYAGPHTTDEQKLTFLLNKLKDVPFEQRTARFVSVVALALSPDDIRIYTGITEGLLAEHPRGTPVTHLPYRQIFMPRGCDKTLDELDDLNIAHHSHRQEAFAQMFCDLQKEAHQ